jgi:anti-sigma28 factor (negative regulator of flagellin synthesis)
MEEAIVDVALDLSLLPSECSVQMGDQEGMFTDNKDQAQFLAGAQQGCQTSNCWTQSRANRVESLRLSVAAGTYHIDSARLALCILRNSTHFLETR